MTASTSDPARCRQPPERQARLGRRALRVHAPRSWHTARRRSLPQTQGHDRARLRQHQVQPWDRPLPTPRPLGRALRMATDHRHAQPAEAAHPPTGHRSALTDTKRPSGTPRAPCAAICGADPGPARPLDPLPPLQPANPGPPAPRPALRDSHRRYERYRTGAVSRLSAPPDGASVGTRAHSAASSPLDSPVRTEIPRRDAMRDWPPHRWKFGIRLTDSDEPVEIRDSVDGFG